MNFSLVISRRLLTHPAFFLPLSLVLLFFFVPPESIDGTVSHAVWELLGQRWVMGGWTHWVSAASRLAPALGAAGVFAIAYRAWLEGDGKGIDTAVRVLAAMAFSFVILLLMTEHGRMPGPAFLLMPLYFAARRHASKWAKWILLAVLTFGVLCAATRMIQGRQSVSIAVCAALCVWLVSVVCFGFGWSAREKPLTEISPAVAATLAGLVATLSSLPFFTKMIGFLEGRALAPALTFALTLWLLYFGLFWLFVRFSPGKVWRPFFAFFVLAGAVADAFFRLYGTIMTPDMIRNALSTDWHEATELLSLRFVVNCLWLWLPGLLLALLLPWVRRDRVRCRAMLCAFGGWFLMLIAAAGLIALQLQSFSSFMRGDRTARYQIMPVSLFYSFSRTLVQDRSPGSGERTVLDPTPSLFDQKTDRPLLVVIVVGETARAANWGLSGYARDTTPSLRRHNVLNFTDVTACGTSTDISVPCMFSRVSRKNYSREEILSQESLLSLVERAGVDVRWVENQGGCKGACTRAMQESAVQDGRFCPDGDRCFDGAFVGNVRQALDRVTEKKGRGVLALHMMGSHGPAYWRRTPPDFRPFGTGCLSDDIAECNPQLVVDSYDNSIAYSDRVLSSVIDVLRERRDVDTVLLYVSDHGESLGEKGMWLHGAPYWMAPAEQTHVPMVMWFSEGAKQRFGIESDTAHLAAVTASPFSHDNLFDTVLGLAGVRTRVYNPALDVLQLIRKKH